MENYRGKILFLGYDINRTKVKRGDSGYGIEEGYEVKGKRKRKKR